MSNGYIESSLKRFLKRKVKVTLGLVVAFMITGTVGFAANGNDYELTQDEGYTNALEWLEGLGNGKLNTGDFVFKRDEYSEVTLHLKEEGDNYKITFTGITTFPTNSQGTEIKTATISKKLFSEKTAEQLNKIFDSNTEKTYALNDNSLTEDISANEFMQNDTGTVQRVTGEQNIINNGFILGETGQEVVNGTAENNGIILGNRGQRVAEGNGIVINKGLIYTTGTAQNAGTLGKAENYGLIISSGQFSQYGNKEENKITTGSLYNYGIIKSTADNGNAQFLDNKGGKAYNYGIIESNNKGQFSQNGRWNTLISNYGTINMLNSNGVAQSTGQGKAENYGLIKVNKGLAVEIFLDNSIGNIINQGVIHSSDSSKIFNTFNKSSKNTGIIITDNTDVYSKDWAKTGVTLNTSYELQNKDTAVQIAGELKQDSFGDQNIGYIKTDGTTLKISDIKAERNEETGEIVGEKKVLGVVAEDKAVNPIFKAENNLVLDGMDMTGYLINGGTFLKVEGEYLALSDTTITVVEDLTKTNGEKAIAVDIGNGKLSLMGESKINGVIKGEAGSEIVAGAQKGDITTNTDGSLNFENSVLDIESINYTDVNLQGVKADKITSNFELTSDRKENTIRIEEKFVVGDDTGDYTSNDVITDSSIAGNKVNYVIKNIDNIYGNIKLGAGENTVTVENDYSKYNGTIDLGTGADGRFIAEGLTGEKDINVYNFHIENAETVELSGGTWSNWADATGTIKHDNADFRPNMVLGDNTTMLITLDADKDKGSDFANYVDEVLGKEGSHAYITGTGNGSVVKYIIGTSGLDLNKMPTDKYSFDDKTVEFHSPIFNITTEKDKGTTVELKTAEEMGAYGQERIIYDAYIEQIMSDIANQGVINQINGFATEEDFLGYIKQTEVTGEAYYTAGSVVTKDITNTYLSAVEDFRKRAEKGEWLAQGKYINSDTEFDGGSKVKGYDGDLTGTMGMVEYGVSENTSYGAVFGMGDAEVDINGGGKLDGDNYYVGAYMKHRTANGIELVGNIGYMKSELDSELRSDFGLSHTASNTSASGTTFEKGTADSSAVVLSLKGRKDYRLSDTVKLQPVLGVRATLINQEKAENPEMHFEIAEQDIIVLEGTAGMGIAKEFALSNGIFELNAGAEYTFAASNTNNNADYTLFDTTTIKLEDSDIADNTGTVYVGADYEHENGVGFNGKYEMMWSDKGDDSRITAGISYRF